MSVIMMPQALLQLQLLLLFLPLVSLVSLVPFGDTLQPIPCIAMQDQCYNPPARECKSRELVNDEHSCCKVVTLCCYIVTLLHCYIVTLLHYYIIILYYCYIVMLLQYYSVTLLYCYIIKLLHCNCYIVGEKNIQSSRVVQAAP